MAEGLNRIPDRLVRADALGMLQANIGLWQILARQGQIPDASLNDSWQKIINPFAGDPIFRPSSSTPAGTHSEN